MGPFQKACVQFYLLAIWIICFLQKCYFLYRKKVIDFLVSGTRNMKHSVHTIYKRNVNCGLCGVIYFRTCYTPANLFLHALPCWSYARYPFFSSVCVWLINEPYVTEKLPRFLCKECIHGKWEKYPEQNAKCIYIPARLFWYKNLAIDLLHGPIMQCHKYGKHGFVIVIAPSIGKCELDKKK